MGKLIDDLLGRTALGETEIDAQQEEELELPPLQNDRISRKSISPLADAISGRDDTSDLSLRMNEAMELDRQRSSRVVALQYETGLPEDMVDGKLDELEAEVLATEKFDFSSWVKSSPTLISWIRQHKNFASRSRDDISKLADLEDLARRPQTLYPSSDAQVQDRARRHHAGLRSAAVLNAVGPLAAEELEGKGAFSRFETGVTLPSNIDSRIPSFESILGQFREEEEFVRGKDPVGFWEGMDRRFQENPAFLLGFVGTTVDIARVTALYEAAKAVEDGTPNDTQMDLLTRFGRLAEAAEFRGSTIWGDVSKIVAELPAFATEFATTGGVFSGVKSGILKGGQEVAESFIKRALLKVVRNRVGANVLGSVAQTFAAAPLRIVKGTIERMTPGGSLGIEDGSTVYNVVPQTGDSFNVALSKAVVDSFAEISSERTGRLLSFLDTPINKAVFGLWTKKHAGKTALAFQKAFREGGVHGIFGEIGEEEIAKLIKSTGELPITGEFSYRAPLTPGGTTGRELLAQAIAFAPGAALSSGFSPLGPRHIEPRNNPQFFRDLGNTIRDTKLIKEQPQIIEQLVREATKNTDNEFSYVSFDFWNEYWQKQKDDRGNQINPRSVFQAVVGDVKNYDESAPNKTALQIPTSRYAVTLAWSEHNEAFAEELKIAPGEFTDRELREQFQVAEEPTPSEPEAVPAAVPAPVGERPERAAGESVSSPTPTEATETPPAEAPPTAPAEAVPQEKPDTPSQEQKSSERVFEEVAQGLRRLNLKQIRGLSDVTPTDIDSMARVFSERYRTRAGILGVDPFELFRIENIRFERVEGKLPAVKGQTLYQAPEEGADITPEARNLLDKNLRTFFDTKKPEGQAAGEPQGRVQFRPTGITVGFLRKANRSTFFHETGHVWLDELGRDVETVKRLDAEALTPEQARLVKDGDAVLEFLGVKSFDKITSKQHDKWAQGVEVYFMEGKAPSSKLRGAFRRIRKWMIDVYRQFSGLRVALTPGVREVMDRLIATENEIQIAQARQNIDALFPDPAAVGMKDKQAAKYAEVIGEAVLEGEEALSTRYMEKVRRKEKSEWRTERRAVRSEVEKEIGEDPAYIALSVLSTGKMPDGTVPVYEGGRPVQKLDRNSILAEYGEEVLLTLPRSVWSRSGTTPDQAAKDLGFESGDDLITTLNRAFEQERKSSPVFEQEQEIRKQLDALKQHQADLSSEQKEVRAEGAAAKRKLLADQNQAAKRIQGALREQERVTVAEIRAELKEIRDAGGIRPTIETERLDKPELRKFKAKEGKGVSSDEFAQDLFDRGLIDVPSFDALIDWLEGSVEAVNESNARMGQIHAEAKRISRQHNREAVTALVETISQQDVLTAELKKVRKDRLVVERSLEVRPRLDAVIDRITDEQMNERHPDMETDQELKDEAVKAVHSEQRSDLLRFELQWLVSEQFATFKKLARRVIGVVRAPENYRKEAQEIIEIKKIREIQPDLYRRAEAKAAREAQNAFLAGNLQEAFEAKERELRNHELFRAASKARTQVGRTLKFVKGFTKSEKQKQLGKAGQQYLDQVLSILERFEFRRVTSRTEKNRASLREFLDREKEAGRVAPVISEKLLNDAYRTNFRDVPLEDLLDIRDTLRKIDHLSRLKNKLLSAKEKREFEAALDAATTSMDLNATRNKPLPLSGTAERNAIVSAGADYVGSMSKAASITRGMDGWKDDGVLWNLLIRPGNDAANRKVEMKQKSADRLHDLSKIFRPFENFSTKTRRRIPELGMSITRKEALSMALNWGNLDNRAKLVDGLSIHLDRVVSEAQIQKGVIDTMTKEEMGFVQGVLDHIDSFWPQVRDLSQKLDGVAPPKVEAEPIVTPHGTFRGGYYPLAYNEKLPGGEIRPVNEREDAKDIVERSLAGEHFRRLTASGHRKRRLDGVRKIVRLDLDVIFQHLNEVIHDLTHYEFLVDANRLIHNPKFRKSAIEGYGPDLWKELDLWLRDVAEGGMKDYGTLGKAINFLRVGAQVGVLSFKFTVAALQPLGITQSVVRLRPKWMMRGFSRWLSGGVGREQNVKWIHSVSSFMKRRMSTQIRDLNEVQNRLSGGTQVFREIQAWGLLMTVKMQAVADIPTWYGGYEKAIFELGLDRANSQEERKAIEEKAVALADQVVIDTQGSGLIKDLSRIQRGSPTFKIFTLFSTFFNARWNLAREVLKQTNITSPTELMRASGDLVLLYAAPAALAFLMREAMRGRDDDDEDFEKRLITEIATEPLGDWIFLRETFSWGYKYEGPAGLRFFSEVNDLWKQFGQGEADAALRRKILEVAGIVLHLPGSQANKTIDGYTEWENGQAGPGALLFGPGPKKR